MKEQRNTSITPISYSLSMGNAICNIEADLPLENIWSHCLGPYFSFGLPIVAPGIYFQIQHNAINTINELVSKTIFTQDIPLHMEWRGRLGTLENGKFSVVQNLQLGSLYLIRHGDIPLVFLLYPDTSDPEALDALRIVRGWVMRRFEMGGFVRCHMAVLAHEKRAIAFIGNQGAGKTSFMLSLLRSRKNYGFVTNDKALVGTCKTEDYQRVFVQGLPLAAAISVDSLSSCPEIKPTSWVIKKKQYLWPIDLATSFNADCISGAFLSTICSCRIDLSAKDVVISRIPPEDRLLLKDGPVLQFSDNLNPHWLLDLLNMEATSPKVADILLDLQWFQLRGNPWCTNWLEKAKGILLEKEDI